MSGIIGGAGSKSKVIGRSHDTAKAWCSIHWSGGTPTTGDSFNISSLGDQGAGMCRFNFISSMANATFVSAGMSTASASAGNIVYFAEDEGAAGYYGRTTSYVQTRCKDANGNSSDYRDMTIIVFGG
jgi:hypothetical protein